MRERKRYIDTKTDMESDITLFLAIEKMMQERMFLHQGKLALKDIDLAVIYDVNIVELRTKIKKNRLRFPPDFIEEISEGEFALTEPGILMLGGLMLQVINVTEFNLTILFNTISQ